MSTSYDPWGSPPPQRREPLDPLLSLPDHPSGEWAATPPRRIQQRVGHPRPARHDPYGADPYGNANRADPNRAELYGADPYALDPVPYPQVAERAARAPRKSRGVLVALLLVLVLAGVAGFQAWRLEQVDQRLNSTNTQLAAALHAQSDKVAKELAGVFDPQAVATNVLPSVFRVRAGNFTGTAFSIGDNAADGQANLLTNFHVVQSIFDAGSKKVSLERGQTQIDATIVKIDRKKDLALLRAGKKIAGLSAATRTVKPGQPVVVAGAPLGLDDTVTSGVVSAYRPDDADGPVIQFDAAINPGNSGGPVVNADDEVIGLATAKARDAEGIGLAVPIKTACDTFKGIC
jgi:putative serine protease PepD